MDGNNMNGYLFAALERDPVFHLMMEFMKRL